METLTKAVAAASTDGLEQELLDLEALVARARSRQLELLAELDRRQVAIADGCRTMVEWVSGRLDVGPETASSLVRAFGLLADRPDIGRSLGEGAMSFDRATATAALAAAGASEAAIAASGGLDIATLRRRAAATRRLSRAEERAAFRDRCVWLQPSLDTSSWRLWGQLPGVDGRVVEEALVRRGDEFPPLPDGSRPTREQRHADALVSIAQDSLTATSEEAADGGGPLATVFVDAAAAAGSNGEAGAAVAAGPRVGPAVLEEILCGGTVELIAVSAAGGVRAVGRQTRSIPPRLRRFVLWRDGGCAADGCTSRYRLQPHHRQPRAQGGSNEPDNLTTLCWYHHHVVIHGMGYRIDPRSKRNRLRFLAPDSGRDPP